jgi:hypothetical protein
MRGHSRAVRRRDAQPEHAKLRAEQRYGLRLNNYDLNEIAAMIQMKPPTGIFVRSHSNTRKEWIVRYQGCDLRLIYNKKTNQIQTFLPPNGNATV